MAASPDHQAATGHRFRASRSGVLSLLVLVLTATTLQAAGPVVIGGLRNVDGRVLVDRGGREIFARTGMRVFERDVIRTGANATLALVLTDDTQIVIGPDSRVSLDRYVYVPEQKVFAQTTSVLAGTAEFVTGALARAAPEAFKVHTPVSTIGIRGTRFLVVVE